MSLFKKILIANRGEIAVRIIRACKELEIKTVAVYSEVDREAMHVKLADEAICIGPANVADSYLNIPAILSASDITDAEAIHPGYGFLSENHQFAEACKKSKIAFIGPTSDNINLAGNKAKAKQILRKKGIPVIPGSNGALAGKELAFKMAGKIGYPVILKASAGGGGRGMRIVNDEKALEHSYSAAESESIASFGSGEIYIEKFLPQIRHVEVQIAVDNAGNMVHLGERDCSVQRRHQKLIEESPSPISSARLRYKLGDYAKKAAKVLKFRNIGTIEFVIDDRENIYFMEINTRVQVEHPVTEMVTGIDIIKEQISLASGEKISYSQDDIALKGHALECRINAEDPFTFTPSPGKINFLYIPGGPGIRVDTHIYSGYVIPSYYDSLIAKVISYGCDRHEAVTRMLRALDEFRIEGIKTTIPFHKKILTNEEFLSGNFGTSLLERVKVN